MNDEWVDADPWEDAQPPLAQLAPGAAQPIGDAPPDFGDARVQPGEVSNAAHNIGMQFAPNATTALENIPAPAPGEAKNEIVQAMLGPFGRSDTAATIGKLAPVVPLLSGLAGLGTGIGNSAVEAFGGTPTMSAADAVERTAKALTYEPKTAAGKAIGAAIDLPFEALGTVSKGAGDKVQDVTGSAALATAVDTAIQALPMLLGADKAGKALEHPKVEGMDTAKANAIPLDVPRTATDRAARLTELDALHDSGELAPEDHAEYASLQRQDREQGKVAHTQEPMEGVINRAGRDRLLNSGELPPTRMMIDLDDFKQINDTKAGYALGNDVIKEAGETLARAAKANGVDATVHLGGDEFQYHGDPAAMERARDQAKAELASRPIIAYDAAGNELGRTSGVKLSSGHGLTDPEANAALKADKQARFASGERTGARDSDRLAKQAESAGPRGGEPEAGQVDGTPAPPRVAEGEVPHADVSRDGVPPEPQVKQQVFTGKTSGGNGRYGASFGRLSEGTHRQLMIDPNGGYFWGDFGEAMPPGGTLGETVRVGEHADHEPALFKSSKEAREAAESTAQNKSAPNKPSGEPTPHPVEQNVPQTELTVSARNAAIDADRAARDLEALPPAERQAWAEPHAEALARIAKEPDYPQTLAREVSAKPRAITATETMALTHDLRRLTTEHEAATKAVLEARSAKDPVAEAQALARVGSATDALTRNHEAIRKGGTEAARSLSIRNAIVKDDYTIGRNMDRAKVAFGDKFNDAIKKHVEDLSERLKSVEAELARKEANKPAPDLKVERKSPDERMQAQLERKMSKLQEAIDKRTKACPI